MPGPVRTKLIEIQLSLLAKELKGSNFPVVKLFRNNRGLSTIMFWIAYFMCLLMIYGLNTWLPNLMLKAGYALGSSLSFLIILNAGAIVGTLVITGACTIGVQNIANAFVSQYYPPFSRSTALGVSSGVGRFGAIIGPTLGGVLLSMSLPIQMNFITFAIPGVIAAFAMWFVSEKNAYYNREGKQNEELDLKQAV